MDSKNRIENWTDQKRAISYISFKDVFIVMCMCVCLHMCACMCMCVCACTYVHAYTCLCMSALTRVPAYVCERMHQHVQMFTEARRGVRPPGTGL